MESETVFYPLFLHKNDYLDGRQNAVRASGKLNFRLVDDGRNIHIKRCDIIRQCE